MKTSKQFFYIAAILAAAIAPSQAVVITVPNASFESPTITDFNVGTPTNWIFFFGSGGSYNPTDINYLLSTTGSPGNPLGLLPGTADGVSYAYLPSPDFMYQQLPDVFLADTTYTFTLALGNNLQISVANNVTFGLASAGGLILGTPTTVNTNNPSLITAGSFADFTYTYTTPSSGGPVGTAIQLGVSAGGPQASVDNVRLSYEAIPEPSTVSAMILGGLIFLIAHRARRRNQSCRA